jgi:hypothetical protein
MPKVITQEEWLSRAISVHGDTYDLSKAEYISAKTPLRIICREHGEFNPTSINFIHSGTGCPKCIGRGADWIGRFKEVHRDRYDYALVEYVDYKMPVRIICREHGEFKQSPDNHYRGKQNCPTCANAGIRKTKQLPFAAVVKRAKKIHGIKFTYSCNSWENLNTSYIDVHCEHGVFKQVGVNLLSGRVSCQKCGNMKSAPEQEVADYLKLYTSIIQRDRKLIAPKEVDIYIPSANLAVEFHGMYWHSHFNAKDEKDNKNKSHDKYKACAAKGIRLITIYETEWQQRQPQIKRLLRNAIGKTKGKIMARKCQIAPVSTQEAKGFYDRYHPQGGDGNGKHYGLYWKGKIVACMRFALGSNDRGSNANRVWTLARYATRVNVLGGASKLFKAFVKDEQPEVIKSFSDNRYFSGGMYEQLGFTMELESQPDYQVWSNKLGLKPKTHYQRRVLQKRLNDHNINETYDSQIDPRTEKEMTYLMGAGRIYDCGKKRWVWVKNTFDTTPK